MSLLYDIASIGGGDRGDRGGRVSGTVSTRSVIPYKKSAENPYKATRTSSRANKIRLTILLKTADFAGPIRNNKNIVPLLFTIIVPILDPNKH
jgi:hypothetical protein